MRKFIAMTVVFFLGFGAPLAQPKLPRTGGLVSLDFHDVDIQDVVKSISEITGKNFVLDDRVRGKVTIMSPSPVSIEEAYQAFLSALEVKNLCAVEVGKVTKIVPLRECKWSPISVEGEETKVFGDQAVTRLIPLEHIKANEIRQALNALVAQTGTMVAYGPTNTLIITDSASNIQRLMKIIQKLDKPGYRASVEIIPLKHAEAKDVADKLLTIFEKQKPGTSAVRRRSDDVEQSESVSQIIPDTRTNSLIVVATREGLGKVLDLLQELDREMKVVRGEGTGRVRVRYLQHADATELAQILSSLITGQDGGKKKSATAAPQRSQTPAQPISPWGEGGEEGFGGEGFGSEPKPTAGIVSSSGDGGGMFENQVHVVADSATNSLIITATPGDYAQLSQVIERLDVRRPQVFVEALIMEVNLTKSMEIGLAGHGASQQGNANIFGLTNLGGLTPLGAVSSPETLGKATGLVLGGVSKNTFTFPGTKIQIPISGATFRAAQTNGALNVLSAPNILTTDNKKAKIVVGQEVPFKVQSGFDVNNQPTTQLQRKNVGLHLTVTPHINEGDEVTLDVEQKIQDVESKAAAEAINAQDIVTSERSAVTTIIAQNGQTVVIGGLIRDRDYKQVTKVPLLGDIPVLGYLFRETSIKKEKTNLVLFLTPHVIHDPQDLTRVSVKKNNERQRFNKSVGVPENRALYDYDLDKGLNMAPPPPRAKAEETPKRRFDYDQPTDEEKQTPATEEEASPTARLEPQVSTPRTSTAATPASTTRRGAHSPFADVRPPSSTTD